MATITNKLVNAGPEINCPICLEGLREGAGHAANEQVQHIFHKTCLVQWLTEHNTCPFCNVRLVNRNIYVEVAHMSEEDRGSAIRNPSIHRRLDMVRELLSHGQISEVNQDFALSLAIKNGHLDVVRELLAYGQISEENRGQAVRDATAGGHLEVVKALIGALHHNPSP